MKIMSYHIVFGLLSTLRIYSVTGYSYGEYISNAGYKARHKEPLIKGTLPAGWPRTVLPRIAPNAALHPASHAL